MKVAYIIGGLPFGGVESWLFDLAHALRRGDEVEPVIVNLSGTGVRHRDYVDSGLEMHSVGHDTRCLNTHRLGTAFKLRALLKDIRPDLIHTMHFAADYFGRLAAIGLGVPVVTHIHNVKRETKAVRKLANKALSYATDMYLAVSEGAAETVRLDHNLAGRPVEVLYNAIDLNKLDTTPHDLAGFAEPGDPVVLAVGRLVEQKNYGFLLRVFAGVRGRVPNARLILIGEGGKRDELAGQIRELGLEGSAFLAGYSDRVPAFMRAARVLAMPSHFEGFPITHIEAMACGLPAVISEHVPSKEVCGETSFVLPLDEGLFTDKIAALCTDEALHARMRAACLAKAPDFALDAHVARLISLYRRLS